MKMITYLLSFHPSKIINIRKRVCINLENFQFSPIIFSVKGKGKLEKKKKQDRKNDYISVELPSILDGEYKKEGKFTLRKLPIFQLCHSGKGKGTVKKNKKENKKTEWQGNDYVNDYMSFDLQAIENGEFAPMVKK